MIMHESWKEYYNLENLFSALVNILIEEYIQI